MTTVTKVASTGLIVGGVISAAALLTTEEPSPAPQVQARRIYMDSSDDPTNAPECRNIGPEKEAIRVCLPASEWRAIDAKRSK